MNKPPCWTKVYPHGTKEGDEELKFFIALARNPKYQWRSTSAIAKEAGLTKERVEEIINKYYKKGMVFQNPKNEDQWGFWSRVPEMLPKIQKSISQKDQDDRIGKLNKCSKDQCCGGSCGSSDPACSKVANWLVTAPEVASIFETTCAGFGPTPSETFVGVTGPTGAQGPVGCQGAQGPACDKVDFYIKPDGGKVFYVDTKNTKKINSEKFMANLKEQFRKKKEVAERWHPPTEDDCGWIPIRPQGTPANADLFICQSCGGTTNQIAHGQQLAESPLCDACTTTEKEWDLDV